MNSLKTAIMKKRANLVGMEDHDPMMKNADLNYDEGSQDQLDIHNILHGKDEEGSPEEELGESASEEASEDSPDGLAPDIENEGLKYDQAKNMTDKPVPMRDELMGHMFNKDDMGKPGLRGKVAARVQQGMKKK